MIKPLNKQVIIKQLESASHTPGGIYLPNPQSTNRGRVVASSAEVKTVSLDDIIVFKNYTGVSVEIDGQPYLAVEEKDIIGVL